jgi:hypothetical protein
MRELKKFTAEQLDRLPDSPWIQQVMAWNMGASHEQINQLMASFRTSPFPDREVIIDMLGHIIELETGTEKVSLDTDAS